MDHERMIIELQVLATSDYRTERTIGQQALAQIAAGADLETVFYAALDEHKNWLDATEEGFLNDYDR